MAESITYTNRNEISINLQFKEGSWESISDIYGIVYLTSPVGSLNSNGLPFPEYYSNGEFNKEFASPVMNGDGLVIKIDFNTQGTIKYETRLLKTPCYYADEATCRYGPLANDPHYKGYAFRNMGVARLSVLLGARNLLNTAFMPFQFKTDLFPRMLATYDVGRPFEISPADMSLITPIGKNKEWVASTPPFLKMPFPLVQSTAHPVFDPLTGEAFLVNYTKSLHTMFSSMDLLLLMEQDEKVLEERLEKLAEEFEQHKDKTRSIDDLNLFFTKPHKDSEGLVDLIKDGIEELGEFMTGMDDSVYLMRWNGQAGDLDKWEVLDENGKEIAIQQCMHQLNVTKDYVILADSSFKFTIDILINNPFPHNPRIDSFIRDITSGPMVPYLDLYLVKRSDLDPKKKKVSAKKLKSPIPLESVHFSANYTNPNNEITLYTAHNSAACYAEWLRPYDVQGINPSQPIDRDWLSMFALGAMDIGRIGKFTIQAETAEIISEKSVILHETGNLNDLPNIGVHTWELGLYTYRDIISPNKVVEEIKTMYFVSFGLDPRTLSEFIVNLYKDYPNRIIPVEEILQYSKTGIPTVLLRLDTDTMQLDDHYQFPFDYNIRSIQFVPRKKNSTENTKPDRDGYILATMMNRVEGSEPALYNREIWFFDAANLRKGPVCKLEHPQMEFGFTLHAAWLEVAENNPETSYKINIQKDYDQIIDWFWWPPKRSKMKKLFEEYVYPHFS